MKETLRSELETLRRELPDSFELTVQLDAFFATNLIVRRLVAGGSQSAQALLAVIREGGDASATRIAALVISQFDPEEVYPVLLSIVERADPAITLALEPGLWRLRVSEERLAKNLARIALASTNSNALLLLQRPAARHVQRELRALVEADRLPISLHALYCLGYALEAANIPVLLQAVEKSVWPQIRALAGVGLLRLGCPEGVAGIEAGLTALDPLLRETTYRDISELLPDAIFKEAMYDPAKPGDVQANAIRILLDQLQRRQFRHLA